MLLCLSGSAMELKMDSVQIGSVTYSNVVITGVNPADIYFHHNGGMANVKLRQLDPELQKKFGFDPRRAAEIERQQMANNERYAREVLAAAEAARAARARARAESEATLAAGTETPFSLADPISSTSLLGKPAPELAATKWFSAEPPARAGKFTLLFFWSSTSVPCGQAIATLNDLSQKFSEKLLVIGLTSETEIKPTEPAIGFFSGSAPESGMAAAFGINSVPSVALIDPKGIVRYTGHPAALTEDALNKLMTQPAAK